MGTEQTPRKTLTLPTGKPPAGQRRPCGLLPARTLCLHTTRGRPSRAHSTHLGGDVEGPVPTHHNLLLHHAEAVEPAQQEAGAVHPEVEVHVVTQEPAQSQRRERSHRTPRGAPVTPYLHQTCGARCPGLWRGVGSFLPCRPPLGGTEAKQTRTGRAVLSAPGQAGVPTVHAAEGSPPAGHAGTL